MNDLIDRQAAIQWVKTECNPYGKPTLEFESGKKVIEHLKQMPSVQPLTDEDYIELHDRFGTWVEEVVRDMISGEGKRWGARMNDLIYRQDAIDALSHMMDTDGFRDGWAVSRSNVDCMLRSLPSAQQWTPVKFRPMDSEEREYWEERIGEKLADEDAVMFDCPMPEDGQEILVSYRKWISMDKCEIDGGCYGLEGNGDWEDIIAWMPSPAPYGKGEKP